MLQSCPGQSYPVPVKGNSLGSAVKVIEHLGCSPETAPPFYGVSWRAFDGITRSADRTRGESPILCHPQELYLSFRGMYHRSEKLTWC